MPWLLLFTTCGNVGSTLHRMSFQGLRRKVTRPVISDDYKFYVQINTWLFSLQQTKYDVLNMPWCTLISLLTPCGIWHKRPNLNVNTKQSIYYGDPNRMCFHRSVSNSCLFREAVSSVSMVCRYYHKPNTMTTVRLVMGLSVYFFLKLARCECLRARTCV